MSVLLLIRSADIVEMAVDAAGQFLAERRHCFPKSLEGADLLGIWLRHELDGDLPAFVVRGTDLAPSARLADPIGIRHSVSLAGLWSLCWIEDPLLHDRKTAAERRDRIVDALVKPKGADPGSFFPVVASAETDDVVETTMRALRVQYPSVISASWFIDDWERGIVGPTSGS